MGAISMIAVGVDSSRSLAFLGGRPTLRGTCDPERGLFFVFDLEFAAMVDDSVAWRLSPTTPLTVESPLMTIPLPLLRTLVRRSPLGIPTAATPPMATGLGSGFLPALLFLPLVPATSVLGFPRFFEPLLREEEDEDDAALAT